MTEGPDRRTILRSLSMAGGLGALGASLMACGAGPVHRPRLSGSAPPRTVWRPRAASSRGSIILVHGLGTSAALWDLPGSGGLAPTLAAAGYTVIAPELSALSTLSAWTDAIDRVARRASGPLMGIGLDLGGTALLRSTADLAARVGIGAPIASGGFSAAMRGVLTAPGAPTWADLQGRTVRGRSVIRLVLTHGLPPAVYRPLVRDALSPMPLALRREWYAPGARSQAPNLLPMLTTPGPGWGPLLVVTAPADGFAPPWQCDPLGFGLGWPTLTVRAPSRVNGDGRAFNHLDLVVHPDARRRVWPSIIEWLDSASAGAAPG